ncbi:mannose-1-phosphate guanylyltransferase [Fulvimarina sp. 2208YS6-2-32]|uniref:Mannose-1-phosphate guanylyltransferase n=1 Tax=Fulvimarina uroteuthidis TaxID=3098149 RepID=A0ABU5I3Q0_9HYPH|nr:mannose-1-phosphate guanylyltransferase [Fulvimarina sp. 2208YS6-2-32]MDY8108801.1 mannose-1-phosphate guanylyltransferase [Fulvimarina sp. 2208YS6-2-32]
MAHSVERTDIAVIKAAELVAREAGMATIVPVILSGGAGTRLWPLSRRNEPKQFQPLGGDHTLFQDTLLRYAAPCFGAPMIIANACQEAILRRDIETISALGLPDPTLVLEPAIRSTAAPIACAALMLAERGEEDTLMLVSPSDHKVKRPAELYEAVAGSLAFVRSGSIALFGIAPTRPETGFGYIHVGPMEHGIVRRVEAFVEKPDLPTAEAYLRSNAYLWNSGMFMFSARTILDEFRRFAPEILGVAQNAVGEANHKRGSVTLGAAFKSAPAVPIDVAVMERSDRLGVVPASFGWSDLGTFHALWQEGEKDARGNVVSGNAMLENVSGSYVRAQSRIVCVYGLDDVCVVETPDAILVGPHADSAPIKTFVETLTKAGEPAVLKHMARDLSSDGDVVRLEIEPFQAAPVPTFSQFENRLIMVVSGSLSLVSYNGTTRLAAGEAAHLMLSDPTVLRNDGSLAASAVVFKLKHIREIGLEGAPHLGSPGSGFDARAALPAYPALDG